MIPPEFGSLAETHSGSRHKPHTVTHGIAPERAHCPAVRCKQTGKQFDRRALARTIGTCHGHHFTTADGEVDAT